MEQKRHWMITIHYGHNDMTVEDSTEEEFSAGVQGAWSRLGQDKRVRFACGQIERCPKSQRLHVQAYIEFNVSLRRSQVYKTIRGDLEPRKGSRDQCRKYVTKVESRKAALEDLGVWREQRSSSTATAGPKARALMYITRDGLNPMEIARLDPECYFTFHRAIIELWKALNMSEAVLD